MERLGRTPWKFGSRSTCQHRGRVLNLSQLEGRLRVAEVLLGDNVRCESVTTAVDCGTDKDWFIACCSLGPHILVMSGGSRDIFAALLDIDAGPLTASTIRLAELTVEGDREWLSGPYLCGVSESRALLYFHDRDSLWYCDIDGTTLRMERLAARVPAIRRFETAPIQVPGGRVLVVGNGSWSRIITLITPSARPTFERVGEIPGEERRWSSAGLVRGRFVVGYGGATSMHSLEGPWVFDLQTRRGSPVAKQGEWHPAGYLVPLLVRSDVLYLIAGRTVNSISLRTLSGLIQDIDVQEALQRELGLGPPEPPLPEQETDDSLGMRDLGGYFPGYTSRNTIDHAGRVLHFSQDQGRLCVTEVALGRHLHTRTVNTAVGCKTSSDACISCCSFGGKILVLAGERGSGKIFCALATVDPGELSKESIHLEKKRVTGCVRWPGAPSLAQISESEVWVSFLGLDEIWIGEVQGDAVIMTEHPDEFPGYRYSGNVPLRLPRGKFPTAGPYPHLLGTTLVIPGKRFSFERLGGIVGAGRRGASSVLIADRFVLGFGGSNGSDHLEDLWLFDLETHRSSPVRQAGQQPPATSWPFLGVRGGLLYVIGGVDNTSARSLHLQALASRVEDQKFRDLFCLRLGLPLPVNEKLEARTLRHYLPTCL